MSDNELNTESNNNLNYDLNNDYEIRIKLLNMSHLILEDEIQQHVKNESMKNVGTRIPSRLYKVEEVIENAEKLYSFVTTNKKCDKKENN